MAQEKLTHWKTFQNPDYLGAYAFQPNEEKTLTIERVEVGTVYNTETNKKEEKRVMFFKENVKPLILNSTNAKIITDLFGTPYVQLWKGKKVTLLVEKVKWRKELVDGVRVKKQLVEEKQAPALNCEECGNPILASGNFSAQQIAQGSKNKYGKFLCVRCATKQKDASQEKVTNENNENQD